jgi:hypothetical protein
MKVQYPHQRSCVNSRLMLGHAKEIGTAAVGLAVAIAVADLSMMV